jgi:SAM-dependent methyltransferase
VIKDLSHELKLTPTRDERTRQEFVASLRGYILDDMANSMGERYRRRVLPAYQRTTGHAPRDGNEVHDAMLDDRYFHFYSAIRYNAQEMVFAAVIPMVERQLAPLKARAEALGGAAAGQLTLDPALPIPANVSRIDVHLQPGSYHSEYQAGDVAPGAIYDNSINVFAFNQMGRDIDDIGHSCARFVQAGFPAFAPRRILDAGCTVGHNTVPWALTFPEAEVTGIDVAPGLLRYAHARAQSLGARVNFTQMNATALQYPDASFDVVFSSMFLHELPLKDIRAFFREAYRVLKPGGLFLNMELPPNDRMEPYDQFYLDWDSFYNKEPYYKPFRDQDYRELCASAGFAPARFLEAVVPRYTYTDRSQFLAEVEAQTGAGQGLQFDDRTGRLSEVVRWYAFGAWK